MTGSILSVIRNIIRKLGFPLDLWYLKGFFLFLFLGVLENISHSQPSGRHHHFYRSQQGKVIHLIDTHFTANFNGMHLLYNWEIRGTCLYTLTYPMLLVCLEFT